MPVTVEQVRSHIEQGLSELGALDQAVNAPVLLWAQQHPDGPDWAVSDRQFMQWAATQTAPEALPTLSLAINVGEGTIEISARSSRRHTSHHQARTAGGMLQATVNVATASGRKETFRIGGDPGVRAEIVTQAAHRYVELAKQLFAVYAGDGEQHG